MADMPALELVKLIPDCLKIGSPAEVDNSVLHALSGLNLVHMAQVPAEVPIRQNTYYFLIENKSPLYEPMLKAEMIAIHDAMNVKDLKLELFAILP